MSPFRRRLWGGTTTGATVLQLLTTFNNFQQLLTTSIWNIVTTSSTLLKLVQTFKTL